MRGNRIVNRRWARRAVFVAVFGALLSLLAAGVASAYLTAPPAGSTQRGVVTIVENRGGVNSWPCGGADSLIQVYRVRDGVFMLSQWRGTSGAWSTTWNTHGAEIGTYHVQSLAHDRYWRWGCRSNDWWMSGYNFTVENLSTTTYTGATSAYWGENFTASANLKDATTARAIGSRSVSFSLQSGGSASGTTDAGGNASVTLNASPAPGTYTLTSAFGGDAYWRASSASPAFTVLKRPTTLTYSGDSSGYWNETGTLKAVLRDTRSGVGIAGKTVSFTLGSASVSATTDSSGTATTSLALTQAPGAFTVASTFAGDANYASSSDGDPFSILKRPTSLAYSGDASGYWNETATLVATLTDVRAGGGFAGQTVTFTLGTASVAATTDAGGVATATLALAQDPADYTVASAFAGDANYASSSDGDPFSILKRPTALAYSGDASGYWTETATLRAVLTDVRAGGPVAGQTVAFTLGTAGGTGVTGSDGVATAAIVLDQDPAPYTAGSSFAGDVHYVDSAATAPFDILKRPTVLAYDGDTFGKRGHTVTLSATLTDERAPAGISGKSIHFELGSFAADAVTDALGKASVTALLDQDPGSYSATAAFTEDGFYLGSAASAAFSLDWEYTFVDDGGAGTVFLNVLTKEFQFRAPSAGDPTDQSSIKQDPGMQVFSVPGGVEAPTPPPAPCDPNDPAGCVPTPPPAPCDPNDPAGCVPTPPPAPCDPNDPAGCVPTPPPAPEPSVPPVPEPAPSCVDDPTGGDPICPADYLPPPPARAAALGPICVDDPTGGAPICAPDLPPVPEPSIPPAPSPEPSVPPVPEPSVPPAPTPGPVPTCVDDPAGGDPICAPTPPPPPAPPCSALPDPQACSPVQDPVVCDVPGTTGCHQRLVTIAFSDDEITLAGWFDLDTGYFSAAVKTAAGPYVLRGFGNPTPPPAPCDPNDPAGCVPPPPAPCDPNDPAGCAPTPPPAPCDPNDPAGCAPTPPPAPEPPPVPLPGPLPSCVDNPSGGDPVCAPA
ncbi:MAG: Ig-like domain repeat protein [Acidobacteria bacterium]|nr:Ig-like domain repeat protein [Acidobacteriota bacterium]